MPQRFPATTRATFTKASGAAPGALINLTVEESRFLIAAGEVVAPTGAANSVAPAVTGTAEVGQLLTCSQGTWTGNDLVYSYRWQSANGGEYKPLPSESDGSTLLLTAAHLGATIRCVVRAINAAGAVVAASNATAAVTVP